MAKQAATPQKKLKGKVSRPGVHAKTKSSTNKNSKNYVKPKKGQG